jgi:hypothetical protein
MMEQNLSRPWDPPPEPVQERWQMPVFEQPPLLPKSAYFDPNQPAPPARVSNLNDRQPEDFTPAKWKKKAARRSAFGGLGIGGSVGIRILIRFVLAASRVSHAHTPAPVPAPAPRVEFAPHHDQQDRADILERKISG